MKQLDEKISNKIIQLREEYYSKKAETINLPKLRRPDDYAIRCYFESHNDSFSLIDFAEWVIKNATK